LRGEGIFLPALRQRLAVELAAAELRRQAAALSRDARDFTARIRVA